MKFNVKILKTKQELPIDIPDESTVYDVINQLKQIHNIDGEIRLVFQAKILKPDQTLQAAQVANDSVLHATIKEVKKVVIEETHLPEIQQAKPVQQSQQPQQPQYPNMNNLAQNSGFQMPDLNQDPKEMLQNPFVQQMMKSPGFMEQMMNNPMMQQLKDKNPQIAELLEDPDLQRQMSETMSDPVKLDEMLRQQDAMMNTIQNTPGAMDMYKKLQYDMEEIQNDFMQKQGQNAGNGFLQDEDTKNSQTGTGNYHTLPKPSNTLPKNTSWEYQNLPASFTDTLDSFYGNQSVKPAQNNPFSAPSAPSMPSAPGMPSNDQLAQLMNDPQMQQQIDSMLENPALFNMYMSNPMIKEQLKQSNPMMASMADNPEQLRQMMLSARSMMKGGDMGGFGGAMAPPAAVQAPRNNNANIEERLNDLRERFGAQCKMVQEMGLDFPEAEILIALDMCNGNVENAINYLLDNNQ